jgi:hypothetical protein
MLNKTFPGKICLPFKSHPLLMSETNPVQKKDWLNKLNIDEIVIDRQVFWASKNRYLRIFHKCHVSFWLQLFIAKQA